ncbi:helix-turn-helix domain-containing protein [Aquimarina algiphila]|uniref:helix-turn-helix domain-containing protein n=1 Tax=Aquimarina algiphila TaxID=2047982 RepID=UPI0024905B21|nr:AraC family transcriptional regulator [Aquimarina algiphila]
MLHLIDTSNLTKKILALLCLTLGLWFFKKVFYGYWQDNLILFLLIGPGKPIFVGSLLLLYYKSYSEKLTYRYIIKCIAIPAVYYITLILFRFFLIDKFPGTNHTITHLFSAGIFIIFLSYFFLTKKELKTKTRKKLIPKAYKKVMILFYSLYFFLLQIPIWDALRSIFKQLEVPNDSIAFLLVNKISIGIYLYLYPLTYILFIYALSELTIFRRLFLPKNVSINENTLRNKKELDKLMEYYFKEEKLYKDPSLNISSCASIFKVSTKELIDYFKITNKGVFKDYINGLRVSEFKQLLQNEKFSNYDLVGLAKECGFKSKSTFFRVFKDLEGFTPNEYKKKVNH